MKGRVIRVSGLQCLVEVSDVQWVCQLRGRVKAGKRTSSAPVIVGDWVEIEPTSPEGGVIDKVYPRYSKFSRAASGSKPYEQIVAVNLDQLIIVVATSSPALRVGFIDRAVVMAHKGDVEPIICINKVDLDPEHLVQPVGKVYLDLGYKVYYTSAKTGVGLDEFKEVLKDRVSVLIGYSGVGKSTLLNRIDPDLSIKTKSLMLRHDRGRHTTAAVRLYPLKESRGSVADTPGIKKLRLWQVERSTLVEYFAEMAPLVLHCQFRDCVHLHEPGCAVREAVERGEIAPIRYDGYRRIVENMV